MPECVALRKDVPVPWESCQGTEDRVGEFSGKSPAQSSTDSMWLAALVPPTPAPLETKGSNKVCAQKLGKTRSLEHLQLSMFSWGLMKEHQSHAHQTQGR